MARSTLAERMNRLEQQKARLAEEEARIRDQERKQRTRRLIETGGLVDKAGLLDLEPNALLGALIAIKAEAAEAGGPRALGGRGREGLRPRGRREGPRQGSRSSSSSRSRSRGS